MPDRKLTELPELTDVDKSADLVYVVDTSDTTESTAGTSKSVKPENLITKGKFCIVNKAFSNTGDDSIYIYLGAGGLADRGLFAHNEKGELTYEEVIAEPEIRLVDKTTTVGTTPGTSTIVQNTPNTNFVLSVDNQEYYSQNGYFVISPGTTPTLYYEILDKLKRGQDVYCTLSQKLSTDIHLPTPKISIKGSVSKFFYSKMVQSGEFSTFNDINSAYNDPTSGIRSSNLFPANGDYKNGYKYYFDIYFDEFIKNREWLNLPELRVELCKTRKSSNIRGGGSHNSIIVSATTSTSRKIKDDEGLRDIANLIIVHPANTTPNNGTIYGGGDPGQYQTEWLFNEASRVASKGNNKGANPNIRVILDASKFIKIVGNTQGTPTSGFGDYGNLFPNSDPTMYLQGYGYSFWRKGTAGPRYKKRNLYFYFRLSAADPTSWNPTENRYERRIYSDLSKGLRFSPLFRTVDDDSATLYCYRWSLV